MSNNNEPSIRQPNLRRSLLKQLPVCAIYDDALSPRSENYPLIAVGDLAIIPALVA
jgi:hypothetical protein